MSFLLDAGATLTLIKVGHLKGDTLIRKKQLALTGMTGHKIYTLGKIKATVILENPTHYARSERRLPNRLRGNTRDRFPNKTTSEMQSWKRASTQGEISFKLHPFKKVTLTPRSETIVQAVTNRNRIGIVSSEEN